MLRISDPKAQVFKFVVVSRGLVFILQLLFNLIPDHKADAFSPNFKKSEGLPNKLVHSLFDGFHKWDSKYFMYIAQHGYAKEQFYAFFPLFPMSIRFFGAIFSRLSIGAISLWESYLLAGWLLNLLCFSGAAHQLFELTLEIFEDVHFALLTTLVFCFNPASIFFSALYTESMFSFFVFSGLSSLMKERFILSCAFFTLGAATRSNGLINAAFLAFYALSLHHRHFTASKTIQLKPAVREASKFKILVDLATVAVYCCFVFVPFLAVNFHAYIEFCTNEETAPAWCGHSSIYSHVQKDHWGLGAFAYYRMRKLPNFLLAIPVLSIVSASCFYYMKKRGLGEARRLGIDTAWKSCRTFDPLTFATRNIFCFVVHAAFLASFALVFMHVEVSTRMLFSSSPLPCWVIASFLQRDIRRISRKKGPRPRFNWTTFKRLTSRTKLLVSYSLGYLFIGCLLHVNFLPWT